jgi:hypothetical protein
MVLMEALLAAMVEAAVAVVVVLNPLALVATAALAAY